MKTWLNRSGIVLMAITVLERTVDPSVIGPVGAFFLGIGAVAFVVEWT